MTPQVWLLPFPESRGAPRRLFANMEFSAAPHASWMPDSRHAVISFSIGGVQPALWLADLKWEKLRKLTASTSAEAEPSLSPRGERLAFTIDHRRPRPDGAAAGWVAAASPCFRQAATCTRLRGRPTGDQLLYATDRTGAAEIWIHNMKAGIDRPMVTQRDFPPGTTTALAYPVFSPDGSRFAFVRFSTDGPPTIWVEPTVGGPTIRLTSEYIVVARLVAGR